MPEFRPQVEHDGVGGHGALCGVGGMEVMIRYHM